MNRLLQSPEEAQRKATSGRGVLTVPGRNLYDIHLSLISWTSVGQQVALHPTDTHVGSMVFPSSLSKQRLLG